MISIVELRNYLTKNIEIKTHNYNGRPILNNWTIYTRLLNTYQSNKQILISKNQNIILTKTNISNLILFLEILNQKSNLIIKGIHTFNILKPTSASLRKINSFEYLSDSRNNIDKNQIIIIGAPYTEKQLQFQFDFMKEYYYNNTTYEYTIETEISKLINKILFKEDYITLVTDNKHNIFIFFKTETKNDIIHYKLLKNTDLEDAFSYMDIEQQQLEIIGIILKLAYPLLEKTFNITFSKEILNIFNLSLQNLESTENLDTIYNYFKNNYEKEINKKALEVITAALKENYFNNFDRIKDIITRNEKDLEYHLNNIPVLTKELEQNKKIYNDIIANAPDYDMLLDNLFKNIEKNKTITEYNLIYQESNSICLELILKSRLLTYDKEMLTKFLKNKNNFINTNSNLKNEQKEIRDVTIETLNLLFIEEKYNLNVMSNILLDLKTFRIQQNNNYQTPIDYMKHCHIDGYACLGSNVELITQAALKNDLIMIIGILTSAHSSINFGDTAFSSKFIFYIITAIHQELENINYHNPTSKLLNYANNPEKRISLLQAIYLENPEIINNLFSASNITEEHINNWKKKGGLT